MSDQPHSQPAPPPGRPSGTKPPQTHNWSQSRVFGLLVVLAIIGILQLPLYWVQQLIQERATRQAVTETEIGISWGGKQTLLGPVLVLPKGGGKAGRWALETGTRYLLPETLSIKARMTPTVLRRGIFESVVHTSELDISGEFVLPDDLRDYPPENAYMILGLGDAQNLAKLGDFTWNGVDSPASPLAERPQGFSALQFIRSGPVSLSAAPDGKPVRYSMSLSLPGHGDLSFLPLGTRTEMSVSGAWPDPSFTGAFLPKERKIDKKGFEANWSILSFGRDYDPLWVQGSGKMPKYETLMKSAFGVKLVKTVDAYHQVERAGKYGNLILFVTFLFYFLLDTLGKRRVHPIQYGILGLSLSLFHVLLLSLSEIVGFSAAYAISCAAILAQAGLYGLTLTGTGLLALAAALLMGSLYGVLYMVLGMESYALLAGSLVLFVGLSVLMYATRQVNWWSRDEQPASG